MAANGKIDDLLSVLHIPLLIAYDSDVLAEGFTHDYLDGLRQEAIEVSAAIQAELDTDLRDFKIHIFLIPVECADTLSGLFDTTLQDGRCSRRARSAESRERKEGDSK